MKKASKNKGVVDPLGSFHPVVREWFTSSFPAATKAQELGWPAIANGESTLILAPTGSGKTLTAFLWCINQLMFSPPPDKKVRCRAIYLSPLKALAVDVERNLRSPILGIARVANESGAAFHMPTIAVRTGDTPQRERAAFAREPADILITTPESLFLLLTSQAREALRNVETVIIDEIHALVPTKRGTHMALSLERLDLLCEKPPQRIGLSATQRPLEEVARFLGGATRRTLDAASGEVTPRHPERGRGEGWVAKDLSGGDPSVAKSRSLRMTNPDLSPDEPEEPRNASEEQSRTIADIDHEFTTDESPVAYRSVTIVDTGERKRLALRVEVPVEEMAKVGEIIEIPSGPAAQGPVRSSIWPALHPRLLELIREHRSTLIFVNSRRLAERLAAALNELAGETMVSAHHGSLAREQRIEIEDRLKSGKLPALIATSSLELGIDMGAIDLVIQIEAPPSVASGMQRIGRASHQAGALSNGIIFPKFRGDLLACAAISGAMLRGEIEPTRYPRNALDVLAQQIVAMVAVDTWDADDLFAAIRCAAPYAELTRSAFDGVLDMLSGLYPSDEFAELRPRITWDRIKNILTTRQGAKGVAVANAGTIPDRGLYGVFLAGAEKGAGRVGELDEEMVFESRPGEVFVLGASSWRIEDITHDRVIVSPAPGEPGKMPFWRGETADRPLPFGQKIGALVREIRNSRSDIISKLQHENELDELAATNLIEYIAEQVEAVGAVPDDRTIVVERCRDELGSWRVCVLSHFGGKIHAPWAMAATAKVRENLGIDVETMWSDDGFVLRFPDTDDPPPDDAIFPTSEEVEALVVGQLPGSSLFAARFRENAARALLLPRRRAGQRAPLWQQRKRASDLLAVAAKFGSFPILLETYRECLRDVFDLPALQHIVRQLEQREIRSITVDSETPSPFAASLLFRYVANYLYDGDAPLAERRAQALSIDQNQLRELLGDAEFRNLLDVDTIAALEQQFQQLEPERRARSADALHDTLLRLGDLSAEELQARSAVEAHEDAVAALLAARRILEVRIANEPRLIAAEDAARYRDALGTPLPTGLPERLLAPSRDALGDLVGRYARSHPPFTVDRLAARWRVGRQVIEQALHAHAANGRVIEGEFTPGEVHREWCDAEVLRMIRRRSLAKLRHEVEPVEPPIAARLLTHWQGVIHKRRGLNSLLDAVELLQGFPLAASLLDNEIFPARIDRYRSTDLDTLAAAGEIVWVGVEPIGEHDGRVALFLADTLPLLRRAPREDELSEMEQKIVDTLRKRGALMFQNLVDEVGGFPNELIDTLWSLVWRGLVTNDTFHALRRYVGAGAKNKRAAGRAFRSRRTVPPGSEGRWVLIEQLVLSDATPTQRSTALAKQLLSRWGIVSRELAGLEEITGGFSAVYDVMRALEDSGKIRRGFFISGVAATQFALPAAVDRLRSLRIETDEPEVVVLAATDPANPYGALLKWPDENQRSFSRSVGSIVILVDGLLAAYVRRGWRDLFLHLPEDEPMRSRVARAISETLAQQVHSGRRRALLISNVNGAPVSEHVIASYLVDAGFAATAMGHHLRSAAAAGARVTEPPDEEELSDDA